MQYIQSVFLTSAPEVSCKINYGVPFFYRFAPLGYLNPTPAGLDVGFTSGHLLSADHPRLEVRNRKIVRSILFAWDETPSAIDPVLNPVLREALLVDEWKQQQKKKGKKAAKA